MQVETRQDDASKIHLVLGCQTHPCVLMKSREVYLQFFGFCFFFAGRVEWNLAKSGRSFHSVGLLSEHCSPRERLISFDSIFKISSLLYSRVRI